MIKKKTIEITVSLNSGSIESPKYDKITLTGLRMKVAVLGGTMAGQGQCQISIHGLTADLMAQLTTTGFIRQQNRNHKILVAAGDKGSILSIVYEGTIAEAYANIQQPISEFTIIALSAMGAAITPVAATSYKGTQQVVRMMQDFATSAGFDFENQGVDKTLNNAYFTGTNWDKIKKCGIASGVSYDLNDNKLTIWQDSKEKPENITISAESGNIPQMIGVPKTGGSGLSITTLFYPNFKFSKSYEIKSKDFPLANGTWIPTSIIHNLESKTNNGAWFTNIEFKRGL